MTSQMAPQLQCLLSWPTTAEVLEESSPSGLRRNSQQKTARVILTRTGQKDSGNREAQDPRKLLDQKKRNLKKQTNIYHALTSQSNRN